MDIFVYGTLKQGYGNNVLLRGAQFVGRGVTIQPFMLYDNGGFPVVMRSNGQQAHNVLGEVYTVDEAILRRIDALEGHPRWYRREEVAVDIGDTGIQQMCWMYIGTPDGWHRAETLPLCPVNAEGAFVWGRHHQP